MKKNIKFVRNIIIVLLALLLVASIINFTPGYRRDKYRDVTNLVIDDENVTEFLVYKIYIDSYERLYIAKDDLERLMVDRPQKGNYIETIEKENVMYVPMDNLSLEYNVQYVKISDTVIIDDVNATLNKAIVQENTDMKYKARNLSKTVSKMLQGEEVVCFDTVIRGWRVVRTGLGEIGYIEDSKLIKE